MSLLHYPSRQVPGPPSVTLDIPDDGSPVGPRGGQVVALIQVTGCVGGEHVSREYDSLQRAMQSGRGGR